MNDSILTPRQKHILNTLNQSDGLQRDEIQRILPSSYSASKPTLIRDLNVLLKENLIRKRGNARALTYYARVENPILREFDIESYFNIDPDNRANVKKTFDSNIINNLRELITEEEIITLQRVSHNFTQRTENLTQDVLKKELERFVIELSWKSSKIEGNTYTLLETESLIKNQRKANGRSRSETTMILNHKIAFDEILKAKGDFKTISVPVINQLHNILTKGLGISSGIRKHSVGITGTTYHPLDNEFQIREALEHMVAVVNNTKNHFEKALIVLCMVPYIQPYSDGNKRTARMLTNAIFLAHDLFPLSYRSIDEDAFKKAILLFYEQHSVCEIKKLFIEQIKFANETYFR